MGLMTDKSRPRTETMWRLNLDLDSPHVEASQSALQEKQYAANGYDSTKISDNLEESKDEYEQGQLPLGLLLYRGTSDPTDWIAKDGSLAGKRVLAVAGSGEIAERFIAAGVTDLEIVDQSPAAAFMNEVRLAAAPHLSLAEYKRLLEPKRDRKTGAQPLLEKEIYQKIRGGLSAQARTYFDTIMLPGYEPFFVSSYSPPRSARARRSPIIDRRREDQVPPAHLKNEETFKNYQARVVGAKHRVQIGDMTNTPRIVSKFDLVYISNIGFGVTETAKLAVGMLDRGVKRVGFTFTTIDSIRTNLVATRPQKVRTGPMLVNMPIHKGDTVIVKLPGKKEALVHIKDVDESVGCTYYAEITPKDLR